MGDFGSKTTVDNNAQIKTTEVESKIQNGEKFMIPPVFPIRPISDKPEPSLYPPVPVSRIDESPERFVRNRLSSCSEDKVYSKKCPSGGYNFSPNANFEASTLDNIAVNTVTTNLTDSNSQIKNN